MANDSKELQGVFVLEVALGLLCLMVADDFLEFSLFMNFPHLNTFALLIPKYSAAMISRLELTVALFYLKHW